MISWCSIAKRIGKRSNAAKSASRAMPSKLPMRRCIAASHRFYGSTNSADSAEPFNKHTTSSSHNNTTHQSPHHHNLNTAPSQHVNFTAHDAPRQTYSTTCDICKRAILNPLHPGENPVEEAPLNGEGRAVAFPPVVPPGDYDPLNTSIYTQIQQSVKKPKRIILMRHGESLANVDTSIHTHTPDYKISLTRKGRMQAFEAGKYLASIIPPEESVKFWVSPYHRARHTFTEVAKSFNQHKEVSYVEEIRLREQEWGNFQDAEQIRKISQERWRYGPFYYRFPNGESGSDVYDRVSAFLETFHRHFGRQDNMVLISHGLTCRIFLMRWHKWSVKLFHRMQNLENAQCVIMELQPDGKYRITTPLILREGSEVGFPEDDFHPDVLAHINAKIKYMDDSHTQTAAAYDDFDEFDEPRRNRSFFVSKSPQSLGTLHYRVGMPDREHLSPVPQSTGSGAAVEPQKQQEMAQ